jgi:hypothetical protein
MTRIQHAAEITDLRLDTVRKYRCGHSDLVRGVNFVLRRFAATVNVYTSKMAASLGFARARIGPCFVVMVPPVQSLPSSIRHCRPVVVDHPNWNCASTRSSLCEEVSDLATKLRKSSFPELLVSLLDRGI